MEQPSHTEEMANRVLATVAGFLSVLGTIFIFLTFIVWHDLRTSPRKILVFLSIGDLLTAVVNLTGIWITLSKRFCDVQAFVNIAAIMSSFFWTVYLSLYIYLVLCIQIRTQTEQRILVAFHITAWGIPLLVAVLAFHFDVLGFNEHISDGWCWIGPNYNNWKYSMFWMLFAGKGWEIISYIAISFFYIKVKLFLKKQINEAVWHYLETRISFEVIPKAGTLLLTSNAVAYRADRKFTFIPIVFVLLRVWGTLRFFLYIACLPQCQSQGPIPSRYWLRILHGIGDSSQGFANFIIFCMFTEKIRTKLRHWCSKMCYRCVSPQNQVSSYSGGESTNTSED